MKNKALIKKKFFIHISCKFQTKSRFKIGIIGLNQSHKSENCSQNIKILEILIKSQLESEYMNKIKKLFFNKNVKMSEILTMKLY